MEVLRVGLPRTLQFSRVYQSNQAAPIVWILDDFGLSITALATATLLSRHARQNEMVGLDIAGHYHARIG
jgi:hypothetical protein